MPLLAIVDQSLAIPVTLIILAGIGILVAAVQAWYADDPRNR
jgi:hypothetical protein